MSAKVKVQKKILDEEFVRLLGTLYYYDLSQRKDEDYVVNKPQMDKLSEIMEFFHKISPVCDGKIEPIKLSPREMHGGVSATFLVFNVYGEQIEEFCRLMSYTSAISIEEHKDGVYISVTVPNVFIKKQDK